MSRLLFIGEGPGDVGSLCHEHNAQHRAYEGDLVCVTEKILRDKLAKPDPLRFQPVTVVWNDIRIRARRRMDQGPRGFDRKLLICLQQRNGDVDAAVAVVDSGDDPRGRLDQLRHGRSLAEREGVTLSYHCAIGVAVKEIEAWLLADEQARRLGFGNNVGSRSLNSRPEDIDDPKAVFSQYQGALASERPGVDPWTVRKAIVEALRPQEVARLCPRGFAPFKKEVEQKLSPLFDPLEPRVAPKGS